MCNCKSYFLLDPKQATIADLLRLLFSSNVQKRKFIDSPPEKPLSPFEFRRRWLIFVSVFVQKLLIFFRKPLALFGDLVAFWLNLVYINGGFLMILPNAFRGRCIWPERSSETFASVVGNLDRSVGHHNSNTHDSCAPHMLAESSISPLSDKGQDASGVFK